MSESSALLNVRVYSSTTFSSRQGLICFCRVVFKTGMDVSSCRPSDCSWTPLSEKFSSPACPSPATPSRRCGCRPRPSSRSDIPSCRERRWRRGAREARPHFASTLTRSTHTIRHVAAGEAFTDLRGWPSPRHSAECPRCCRDGRRFR